MSEQFKEKATAILDQFFDFKFEPQRKVEVVEAIASAIGSFVNDAEMTNKKLMDGMEMAWIIIAAAGNGSWEREGAEWTAAAERWRDQHWHPALKASLAVRKEEAKTTEPQVGQVWVRRRWWGATQKRTVTHVNTLSRHGAFVTYRAGNRLRNHRDVYLDDWHRWSRKATLIQETDHG